ncbi:RteC domain-containing protein [Flavobacterium sp. LS2P90]|uniref:RteC domain-containing protein n=1 Tax=Flavobacterium xylosi TaxID=3230415 RepID=A0ABW6HTN7_9FLAO
MREKIITTLKEYKETYLSRLNDHESKYVDYDELHFINKELYFYQNCFSTANVSERRVLEYNSDYPEYKYCYLNEFEFDVINNEEPTGEENYDIKSLIKDESKWLTDGYDIEICDQLTTSFSKIIEYLRIKINTGANSSRFPKVKFHGSQTEFIELIKALTENGNLKGIQKDNIELCSKFFDIEIKNPDQTLTKLKSRNNGSETLFLDKLKISLRNHFTL